MCVFAHCEVHTVICSFTAQNRSAVEIYWDLNLEFQMLVALRVITTYE